MLLDIGQEWMSAFSSIIGWQWVLPEKSNWPDPQVPDPP